MDFRHYTRDYRDRQRKRIADTAQKIATRAEAVRAGRVVPEHADIPIGTGRRLQAAVLFLDICGFSSRLSNTQDEQERLLRALSIFFTEMFRVVNDYGGVVEKNTGDGLMVYFADNAGANGAERAVACAATMKAANDELESHIARVGVVPFEFRIGIDYGWITVAQIGARNLFGSVVAIGATANIANKMLRKGQAGQIIVGESAGLALPDEWKQLCLRLQAPSGFVYTADDREYPFYLFDATWVKPVESILPVRLPALPPYRTPPKIFPGPPALPPELRWMEILAGIRK